MASEHEPTQRESKVVDLLHEAARQERAPESLRASLNAQHEAARRPSRPRRTRVLGLPARWAGAGLGGTALGGVTAALVLILSGSGGALSIAQAATLATLGSNQPAPRSQPGSPGLLTAGVGDLQFPDWVRDGGFRSTGERTDTTGGRRTVTVYYVSAGQSVAYSIVAAPVLTGLNTHGERYATFVKNGRTTVVWQERNHTCLLSGVGISARSLWQLAAKQL